MESLSNPTATGVSAPSATATTTTVTKKSTLTTVEGIFGTIADIAGDIAGDQSNPVLATYGVGVDVLATTLKGLLGLFAKHAAA